MRPERLERIGLDGRTVTLTVAGGRIAAIAPAEGAPEWLLLPPLVDPHVHLDKTFTCRRAGRPGHGLFAAIEATHADMAHWTEADLRARASRALAEAEAAGVAAMRSHVDWIAPEVPRAWPVLGDLAAEWAGRVAVQRAALCPADLLGDPDHGPAIARAVAQSGDGVLGAFVYRNDDLPAKLARIFRLAAQHDLRLDFHTDEGLEPEAQGFDAIVRLTAAHGMAGRVLCGHACALSVRPEAEARALLAQAAEAGVALSVQPTTNLWLQDAAPGRTPRRRGLAPLIEARAAGVEVMFGADNVADPFYPVGSYDPLEVLRLAVTAAQLDPAEWCDAVCAQPARALGHPPAVFSEGAPADFVLVAGGDWTEALRAPPRRRVFRRGRELAAPPTIEVSA